MLNMTCWVVARLARERVALGHNSAAAILFTLAALTALPGMAADSCSHLGIETVNWKSPDSNQAGVLVLQVQPGCVAATLGVRAGDTITAFNGTPIGSQYDLQALAGKLPADQAFSLVLRDGETGALRTLHRDAPDRATEATPHAPSHDVPGDWLSWYKWAGLFLILTVTLTPIMWWILRNHALTVMSGGVIGGLYDEYKNGGRRYIEAGIQGALISLLGLVVFILIGPVGFLYALYQPLSATLSDADMRLCCVEDDGKHALSPDGRWMATVRPTPDRYFGLGDKIARAPYVAALADLQTGRFVAWHGAVDGRWMGVEPSAGSGLREVVFDNDGQPHAVWSNGFSTSLVPADQPLPAAPSASGPDVRFDLVRDDGGQFVFTEVASGRSFVLAPDTPYDKWWLSADGRVLALAKRPYQPDPAYDGWATRAWHAIRNFVVDDWTVTFFDVGGRRKLASYTGYGYDGARWNDGRFLDASLDGLRWVMVRDNGYVLAFDLSDKLASGFDAGEAAGRLYQASAELNEIAFYREADALPTENLQKLAALAGLYPTTILEQNPHLNEALRRTLGQSYTPLMAMLSVEMPAKTTPDGGLSFTQCKAHACYDGKLVVYVSPSFEVSALLFHNEGEISLPETPAQGEANPDNWSRLVLYAPSANPLRMPWALYEAALSSLDGMDAFATNTQSGRASQRFWIVGALP